jgi:glycolate oxidase FAD binding subunit
MVVKNVSGFDLMRMHLGALGTLGVIVSANFKVVPAARAEATVLVERETIEQLEGDRLAIHGGRIRPIAYEAYLSGGCWTEAIRIEGRPATVDQMARELADQLGNANTISTEESRQYWRDYVRQEAISSDPEILTLQVRGRPAEMSSTLSAASSAFGEVSDLRVSLGLGTVRLTAPAADGLAQEPAAAIASLRASGRNVLLLNAPKDVHATLDAFGTPESNLELMRQLKRQFDPWSALNPGRVIPEL